MKVNVPISHSVNVLIIGMSSGAVSAAAAARKAGASVLCVNRTTFPGEDIASPMRYWPELSDDSTPLTRALFAPGAAYAPSPMHVKYTLERVLLDCGAAIRYMSYPAFLLRDESGALCGAVIANRSGFEAVLAGTIIDATTRAVVARMSSARFASWRAGPHTFTRTVLTKTPIDSLAVRAMPTPIRTETGEVSAFEYTITIDMPDSSPQSFGRAQSAARLATWDPTMLWGADELFHVPQDRFVAAGKAAVYSPGAGFEDTAPFTCENGRLFILGPCASVSDDAARALCSPGPLMVLGEKIGALAAAGSVSRGETKSVTVDYRGVAPCDGFDVVRRDRYFRLENAANIEVDLNRLATIGGFDVVVAGGGTAGAGAGISASRDGSTTLVAEYLSGLGGVSTEGRICSYYHGNRVGFTAEMDIGVHEMAPGCEFPAGSVSWNPEWKKQWYLRAASDAGAEVWFGAMSVAAAVCGECVCGVALATPYAPVGLVTAKTVVDATGNADIAAVAGAQVVVISRAHVAVQGSGLPPVTPGRHYTNTDYTFIDDCDVADVSAAFIRAREKFKTQFDLAQIIDSRQRRQVRGDVSP